MHKPSCTCTANRTKRVCVCVLSLSLLYLLHPNTHTPTHPHTPPDRSPPNPPVQKARLYLRISVRMAAVGTMSLAKTGALRGQPFFTISWKRV
jgi:hypothetical protein